MSGDARLVEIVARLTDRWQDLVDELVHDKPASASRTELRFGGSAGLVCWIGGPRRGQWADFRGAGPHDRGAGDALAFVAHQRGCTMKEAVHWALDWLGEAPRQGRPHRAPRPAPAAADDEDDSKGWSLERARMLWRSASTCASCG